MTLSSRTVLTTRLVTFAGVVALVLSYARATPYLAGKNAERDSTRHALLIGVTDYPRLGTKYRLQGPSNDVRLIRGLLEAPPFSVRPSNIVALAGWPDVADVRPTRTNIEREFLRLASSVEKGDQILVLMAGHGSQQPANEESGDPEPDGLDEIFLPADAAGWNGQIGRVENAIVDDDIRRWVTALRNRGAFVWVVFDSCHSGTMVRGLPSAIERERQIPVEALIPAPIIEQARQRETTRAGAGGVEGGPMDLLDPQGGLAALYAAQMHETTPERPLPDAKGQVHGLFTYTLADVLARSSTPLTYRELADRVLERYRSMGRPGPTPALEGGGLDRLVLGQESFPDRPRLLLGARAGNAWELLAGSIHGLTPNSILQLFPPAGAANADMPIGHVKVVSTRASTALVEPVAFNGSAPPGPNRLVEQARARVVDYDYGSASLRVAVQWQKDSGGPFADLAAVKTGAGPEPLERSLTELSKRTSGLALRTESLAEADWLVRAIADDVVLVPASGWIAAGGSAVEADVPSQFRIGTLTDPALAQKLAVAVQNVARARNLMRLAQGPSQADISLKVQLLRYDSESSTVGRPLRYEASGPSLTVGEYASFEISNTSSMPLDVTLLFISSQYGIEALYPSTDQEIDNRVAPGQTVFTMKFKVGDDTLGQEHVVAIGVPGGAGPRVSFALLEQPSIAAFRTRGAGTSSGLGDLLEQALYGSGTRSGFHARSDLPHAFQMISWRTVRQSVAPR